MTRIAPPKATLGDDIFGVLCDRIGAGALTEDLSGASYHAVCHYTNEGVYADKVDVSLLPTPAAGPEGEKARALSIAKVEAMARRRSDLVHAFNAIFPEGEIDDVTTEAAGDKVQMRDALLSFSQNLARLYDTNPFEPSRTPTVPASTRGLADLFAALADSAPARDALVKIWGRQGYRPAPVALGAVRPLLSYPRLRPFANAALDVLAPDGKIVPELSQILRVLEKDLASTKPTISALPPITVDAATAQPSRPMEALEMLSRILLDEHPSYARDAADPSLPIARRDRRGFVVPLGNTPGQPGTVPAPFSDLDNDGFADVDGFGQFVTANNVPVPALAPFVFTGTAGTDELGRPTPPVYTYIDTSRTLLGSIAQNLVPLVDATQYASGEDAWKSEHETLMYAVSGAYLLFGDREDAQYDPETGEIKPADESCATCFPYRRFKAEGSPLPDLAHALGQILADPESDALLLGLIDLVENHEDLVARLLGAALRIREIAVKHDALAAQGKEPLAGLPYETPIWDEIAAVMDRITDNPGLTAKLIASFAHPLVVSSQGGAANLGDSIARFMTTRDQMTYDVENLNGPAWNLTDGTTLDPNNPVDWTKPLVGENRSCWERTLDIIHNANNVKACNKDGAKVKAKIGGSTLTWPIFGSGYDECELLEFGNLGTFYLDSILPENHPKRAEIKIRAGDLDAMLNFFGIFTSTDEMFENSSGIKGLTLHPTPAALNRFVFFGASSEEFPAMPDLDPHIGSGEKNVLTNTFISAVIEPVPTVVCPIGPNGTRQCATQDDLLRLRGRNTLFLLERYGFYDYLQPLVTTFANATCNANGTQCEEENGEFKADGEVMLLDIIETLKRHWPGPDHGPECSESGNAKTNPSYCSGAGVNRYEPILAEAFVSDIVPALHEFSKLVTQASKITVARGPKAGEVWTGAQVLEKTTRILFNQKYASDAGMADRKGNKSTKWTDGTPQAQVTGFTLFADAFHGMDVRFDAACECGGKTGEELAACQAAYDACRVEADRRKGQWKRARSQLVDQFLGIEGEGASSKFANRAIPRALVNSMKVFREQVNAHCPDRESGTPCTWAKTELGKSLSDSLSGPLAAATIDLLDRIRGDEAARRELEKLLDHLLRASSDGDALQASLSSFVDVLQVLAADAELSPILEAASAVTRPEREGGEPGALPAALQMLKALTSDEYDKYHVLDHILPNVVTPMNDGKGPTPLEVLMDTAAEVSRIDAAQAKGPLDATDYEFILKSARDFLTSDTRGLEQLYTIVQKRPRD
ncbi:hypothetical protein [Polyangium aurulentum]|uniref:hypothetical protein n=1 Tax=Polyangium aurulentum TaxID=2567896 RepID=UPI0010AE56B1|nr:hypothetical protein [Polyangium aurulentum]